MIKFLFMIMIQLVLIIKKSLQSLQFQATMNGNNGRKVV